MSMNITNLLLQKVQEQTGATNQIDILIELMKNFNAEGIGYEKTAKILGLDENFVKSCYEDFTTITDNDVKKDNLYIVPVEREVKDILFYKVTANSAHEAYNIALDYCKQKGDPRSVVYSISEPLVEVASKAIQSNSPFTTHIKIEKHLTREEN